MRKNIVFFLSTKLSFFKNNLKTNLMIEFFVKIFYFFKFKSLFAIFLFFQKMLNKMHIELNHFVNFFIQL